MQCILGTSWMLGYRYTVYIRYPSSRWIVGLKSYPGFAPESSALYSKQRSGLDTARLTFPGIFINVRVQSLDTQYCVSALNLAVYVTTRSLGRYALLFICLIYCLFSVMYTRVTIIPRLLFSKTGYSVMEECAYIFSFLEQMMIIFVLIRTKASFCHCYK